jgi:hypothetical protein
MACVRPSRSHTRIKERLWMELSSSKCPRRLGRPPPPCRFNDCLAARHLLLLPHGHHPRPRRRRFYLACGTRCHCPQTIYKSSHSQRMPTRSTSFSPSCFPFWKPCHAHTRLLVLVFMFLVCLFVMPFHSSYFFMTLLRTIFIPYSWFSQTLSYRSPMMCCCLFFLSFFS